MTVDSRSTTSSQPNKNAVRRRVAYSLAAGAAAIGTTTDANAEIVYSGLQNININQLGALNLDLDAYGATPDIKLKNYVFGGNYMGATVLNAPGKLVLSNSTFPYYVTALDDGAPVRTSTLGSIFYGSMAYAANPNSEFQNVTDAYVGLSFPIGANEHFGWVRVDVNRAAGTFLVKDWAYQDVSGQGILAGAIPEPTTLGMLAAGALGVVAMRRKRRSTEAA